MVESILALVQHPTLTARGQMNVFFAVCRACAPAILCTEQQQWGATAIQQHHPVNRSCRSYLYAQACSCGPPDGIGKGSADASTPGPDAGSTASARAAAPKKDHDGGQQSRLAEQPDTPGLTCRGCKLHQLSKGKQTP
ncbi:hypothetical protein ABBQ38_007796 [Trebouxia sp. C0009 RCD-2024]